MNKNKDVTKEEVPFKFLQANYPAGLSHKAVMIWAGSAGNAYIGPIHTD